MEIAAKDYIINTVFRTNIVPLISECNTSCIFCSHKQNPEGIEVYRMPKMDAKDFEEIISFLSPDKKIIIGESATRIIEGEPLLHPDFLEIIASIRRRYPSTPIQVTTNGILLEAGLVDQLERLGNIELNLSINAADPEMRSKLLGLKRKNDIREKLCLLSGRLKFSGSCVMVPEVLPWSDVEDLVALLDANGAEAVRVFLPGYTTKAEKCVDYFDIHQQACAFIGGVRKKYALPMIIEPSLIQDLLCYVEGCTKGSPSERAGLMTGDVVVQVNGKEVRSRVEGFNLAFRLSSPLLTVLRNCELKKIKLEKPKHTSPGFVVLYDIDPDILFRIEETVRQCKANKVLFVTSELAYGIMACLLKRSQVGLDYRLVAAENRFFGGTIKCAGLLTAEDVIRAAQESSAGDWKPDLVLLPPVMFDFKGKDLRGTSMREIAERLAVRVDIG